MMAGEEGGEGEEGTVVVVVEEGRGWGSGKAGGNGENEDCEEAMKNLLGSAGVCLYSEVLGCK